MSDFRVGDRVRTPNGREATVSQQVVVQFGAGSWALYHSDDLTPIPPKPTPSQFFRDECVKWDVVLSAPLFRNCVEPAFYNTLQAMRDGKTTVKLVDE